MPAREPRRLRLGGAAALLAASVALSRVLGYAREAVLAHQIGAGAAADAYYAAFQIPDLLNYLLAGGALAIAFIPLYARRLAGGDLAGADRLFGTVLGTLGAVSVLAAVVLFWQAEPLIALQFPRFDPETRALTVRLTRIVLPAQIFFVTGGIVRAALMARGRFAAQAAAPVFYNGAIIAGGLLLAPRIGVEGFAWGVLAGALLGPLLVPLLDARGRVPLRLRVSLLDRDFLRYLAVAAPLMLGLSLLTVDEWYERWFGALLEEGTVAYLGYARRLMQVPVAIVGQAIAAAALPVLSQLFAEGRHEHLNRTLERTLRAAAGLAVLAGAAFVAFAQPVVELIYRHGAFTAHDADRVAAILSVLAFAVPAWVLQQVAARAFYARGDTWRPMLLSTVVALLAVPLYLELGDRFGAVGLAAAGALAMGTNALATLGLARRLHGAPRLGALAATAARATAVAVPAVLAGRAVLPGGEGLPGALVDLAAGGAVFAAIAGGGACLFGDADLVAAVRALVPRRRRAPPGA